MCAYRERRSRARCCCSESVLLKASGGGTHAPATPATPQTPPPALRYTRPPYTTTIYVSWYYYICVVLQQRGRLAKLKASCTCSLRPHIQVRCLPAHPHTSPPASLTIYVFSQYCICVLILLYTQVQARIRHLQRLTCRRKPPTAMGSRYSVSLLYWYKSTNTDSAGRIPA